MEEDPGTYSEKLLEKLYWNEFDRKDGIDGKIGLPVSLAVLFAGVLAYFVKNLPPHSADFWTVAFEILLSVFFICLMLTVYFLVRAFYGHAYQYVANPKQILDYEEQLREYYERTDASNVDEQVAEDMRKFLTVRYAECAECERRSAGMARMSRKEAAKSIRQRVVLEIRNPKDPLGRFENVTGHDFQSLPRVQHDRGKGHHGQQERKQVLQARILEHAHILQVITLLDEADRLLNTPPPKIRSHEPPQHLAAPPEGPIGQQHQRLFPPASDHQEKQSLGASR